jgi:hypothetical protein
MRRLDMPFRRVVAIVTMAIGGGILLPPTPNGLYAQDAGEARRFLIGVGLGVGAVVVHPGTPTSGGRDEDESNSRFSLNAQARIGWRASRRVSLLLEYELHRLHDESPKASDVGPDLTVTDFADVLRTQFLLLSAQIGSRRGLFVRPGLGFGQHRFGGYIVCDVPGCRVDPHTSSEVGVAAGIVVGIVRPLSERLDLSIEGLWRYSQGEDSTIPRSAYGVQAVAVLGF